MAVDAAVARLGRSTVDLLPTAVVALDADLIVRYANPAAEDLFGASERSLHGQSFPALFAEREALERSLREATRTRWDYAAQTVSHVRPGREPLALACIATGIELREHALLVELRPIEQQLRLVREERMVIEQQSARELLRNLAHEIKNPLGGLRGSAQLLERELERPELREYTQVIIQESDRLQALMDRMLAPHRTPKIERLGIHEVLERVILQPHAVKRLIEPEEVAGVIAFLAGPGGAAFSGVPVTMDLGWSAR